MGRLLTLSLLLPVLACSAESATLLDPFPPAPAGQTRLVLQVPEAPSCDDGRCQIELVAGKTLSTDGVNQVRLDAVLEPRNLQGWGYTYYEVRGSLNSATTLMAPQPGQPEVSVFVGGTPLLIRYNPRLPVVVYAPVGISVRYRLWRAPVDFTSLEQG